MGRHWVYMYISIGYYLLLVKVLYLILVVLQWCLFIIFFPYILYTQFLSEVVLRFQHIAPTLSFRKLDQDSTLKRSFFDFTNSYLMPREKPPKNYEKSLKMGF